MSPQDAAKIMEAELIALSKRYAAARQEILDLCEENVALNRKCNELRDEMNKIRCKKCGDVIESLYRHDFKFCKCGAVAVDGGQDYCRRIGNRDDYEEVKDDTKA